MIKIKDITPKCLVLGTTFNDFSIATQKIDNSIEDLCSYIINDTNNYYFLNLESIWSKIGFQWIVYNDYGHFTKSNIPFTIIPVIPDADRLKSFYRLLDGVEQDVTLLDSDFKLQDLYSLETNAVVDFKPKNIKYIFGKKVTLKVNNKLDNIVVAKYRNEDNYDKNVSSGGLGLIVDKDTIQYFPLNIEYDENNKDITIPNKYKSYFNYYLYLYIKDNLQNSIDISSLFKYNNRPYVTRLNINIDSFTQPITIPVFGYNGPNTGSRSKLYYYINSEDNSKNGVIFDFTNFTKNNKGKDFDYSIFNINNIEYKNIENCADNYINYLYNIDLRDKNINFIIDETVCSKCKYIFYDSSRLTISVNNMNNIFVNLDFSKCTDSSNAEIKLTEYSYFTIEDKTFYFISNNPINGYFSNKTKVNEMFACITTNLFAICLLHFKTKDNIFYNYSGGYHSDRNALYLLNQQVYINTSINNSYIYIDYDENYNNKPFVVIDNTNVKNITYKGYVYILYTEKIISYNVNIPIIDILDKDIESIKQLSIDISSILYDTFNNFVDNNITINQDVYICNSQNATIEKINQTENSKFIIYNNGITIEKNDLFDESYINKILNAFIFDDNDKNKSKTIYIYTDYYKLITGEQKITFIEHNYDIVEQI